MFLEPPTSYRVIQTAGRESGEALAISEQTLKKRLHEKKLLASVDTKRETLTIRRTLGGSGKHVLHFSKSNDPIRTRRRGQQLSGFWGPFVGYDVGKSGSPDNDYPEWNQNVRTDLSGLSGFKNRRELRRIHQFGDSP